MKILTGFLLISLLVCPVSPNAAVSKAAPACQKVFLDWGGVGKELAIDVYNRQLRLRKPRTLYTPTRYDVDGLQFRLDKNVVETNYQKHEIGRQLTIRDGALFYEDAPVALPQGVEMRTVWQAILWEGWIICLGRTSKTDKEARLKPPFFATELITFNVRQRVAQVRYVNFDPPKGVRLYILDSAQSR